MRSGKRVRVGCLLALVLSFLCNPWSPEAECSEGSSDQIGGVERDTSVVRFAERYVAKEFNPTFYENAVTCTLSGPAFRMVSGRQSVVPFDLLLADRPWMDSYMHIDVLLAEGEPYTARIREIDLPCHLEPGGCSFPVMKDSAAVIASAYGLMESDRPWHFELRYSHADESYRWRVTGSRAHPAGGRKGQWVDIDVLTGEVEGDSGYHAKGDVIAVSPNPECK